MRRILLASTILISASAWADNPSVTPGSAPITDAQGNVWQISPSGSIQENGNWVNGGGETAMVILQNGTVYGLDSTGRGWFTLSSGDSQYWTPSDAPTGAASSPVSIPATMEGLAAPTKEEIQAAQAGASAAVPCSAISTIPDFSVLFGKIYAPDQSVFIPRGVNVGPDTMGAASPAVLKTLFPGINFVRFATYYTSSTSDAEDAYVESLAAAGIVVEIEDHPFPSPLPYSGQQLADESAWYVRKATKFAGIPWIWFGTMNEPHTAYGAAEAAITAQEVATYNAIRGTGSRAVIMLELFGGGNPGTIGDGAGMTTSAYASMTNIVWDLHYYGWASNYSTDQGAVSAALAGSASGHYGIAAAQTIKGAGGQTIPVVIGEFGDSTTGSGSDPNGTQVINAVLSSGYGFAAWTFGGRGGVDSLTQGGGLTSFGQSVSSAISGAGAAAIGDVSVTSGCAVAATAPAASQDEAATVDADVQAASTGISQAVAADSLPLTGPIDLAQLKAELDAIKAELDAQ